MPTSISESAASLRDKLQQRALAEGLTGLKITRAALPPEPGQRLQQFVAASRHGDMDWFEDRKDQRANPANLWPAARTAIVLAQTYGQGLEHFDRIESTHTGLIAQYALNRDYHVLFKGKLKRLASWLRHKSGAEVKVFVDTAPLMEKPIAQQAGLGWQGKHTNLVSQELGSWFFIGTILTTAELPVDAAETDHCGSCQACLEICPTKAFPAPFQLDARRCISYLTIEHQGHIDREFRGPMGNRIYGCDDCLAVCPWNKFAAISSEMKLAARDDLLAPPLRDLLQLDDAGFRKFFTASPIKRTGRNRFIRNCLIAAGNSGDISLLPVVKKLLDDASPLVRAMAIWALARLADATEFRNSRKLRQSSETDAAVMAEWDDAHE